MPEKFGPFELERLLGRGGMAEVFLATRNEDAARKSIVVKRIRFDLQHEPEYHRRFVLEAQVASRLSHPNLVGFRQFGRVGECHYIALEYIRGFSLHRLVEAMSDGAPPPELPAALHIGAGILDGLGAMHAVRDENNRPRPMLHRDVTPANVIIAHDGRPVIIDFGITKDVLGPSITLPGRVIGTARYMAPEHRRCEYIDARADVFSASVILFEVITGTAPWPVLDTMKELLRVTFDPPELTDAMRARLPADVADILFKGLACEPSDRWRDAAEMSHALASCASFAGVADEGAHHVARWLERQTIPPDEKLTAPVVDFWVPNPNDDDDDSIEVLWRRPSFIVRAEPPSAPAAEPTPETPREAKILTIPPLPPRRDASLAGQITGELLEPVRDNARRRRLLGISLLVAFGLTIVAAIILLAST